MLSGFKAVGFHVAGLQFVNPIGVWRQACLNVNQGTKWQAVRFHPVAARSAYRAEVVA